jgi:tetratricopeptide (TPR) repeat protein
MTTPDDRGFRPLLTRAPFAEQLLASPTEYDAAPAYVAQSVASNSDAIKRAVAERTADNLVAGARDDTLGQKARLVVELAAPVGFGVVRVTALASQLVSTIATANPVIAVLTVPALFLTGRKALDDLKRALVVDPKVRDLIARAHRYTEAKQFTRAEELLQQALETDIDPTYRRNGDLYLQLGLIQFQDRRPRQAMVSFAKASVLFGEGDALQFERNGATIRISKRGWTELLACAAIDSFAHDEEGIREWTTLLGDFARSAERRFEHHAELRETGTLLGLFGVDPESAAECRALAAKVRFLRAKISLRAAGSRDDAEADVLIDAALHELRAAHDLTPKERADAILEQAQFYAGSATRNESARAAQAQRALRLMAAAADELAVEDPATAARLRAEAAGFALDVIPAVVAQRGDVALLRASLDKLLNEVSTAATGTARTLDLAPVVAGWVEDQRYRLSAQAASRAEATRRAHAAYLRAGEPVSAMYAALRLAYATEGGDGVREAIDLVLAAARDVLERDVEPVSRAFAAKYLLDASELVGITPTGVTRLQCAEMFRDAARAVQRDRRVVAFHLRGKLVVHSDAAAQQVLTGQAALEYARAGRHAEAVALLEEVRARSGAEMLPAVRTAIELDHGAMLVALGDKDEAERHLRAIEREVKHNNDLPAHRRALELLDRLRNRDAAPTDSPEGAGVSDDGIPPPPPTGGLLDDFAAKRDLVLREGRALLEIVSASRLDRVLRTGDRSLVERIAGRLRRLEEGRFRVGIVGEFSSGKSTFLNALLGEAILPSSVRPTTCSIGHLRWGETKAVVIRYDDGRPDEQRPLDELEQFVTEKGNPKNRRRVREVEIEYPLPLLRQGVELVDTPGVSSLIAAHTETTYRLLPTCDAVVFLATGRQPYSESGARFLNDVRAIVDNKLFYVVNKIDQLEPTRQQEALKFLGTWLEGKVDGARVFPTAAYHALIARRLRTGTLVEADLVDDPRLPETRDPDRLLEASGVEALERELGRFLSEHRGKPLLRSVARELLAIIGEVERGLGAELHAAKLTRDERQAMWKTRSAKLAEAKADVSRLHARLQQKLHSIVDEVEAQAGREIPTLTDGVMARIAVAAADAETDEGTKQRLGQRIRGAIRDELGAWLTAIGASVAEKMQREMNDARRELLRHQRALRAEFGSALQREVAVQRIDDVVDAVALDDLAKSEGVLAAVLGGLLGAVVGFAFGLIGLAVLAGISFLMSDSPEEKQKKTSAKIRELVSEQLEKMAGAVAERLRERLEERVEDQIAGLHAEEDEAMAGFERELDALLRERDDTESMAQQKDAEMRRAKMKMAEVERRIGAVLEGEGR